MWTTSHNKKVITIEFLLYLCTHTALLSWLYSCAKFLVENGCSAPWLAGLDCEKQLCADQYSPQNPRIVQNIELHSLWNIKTCLWVNLGDFCWRYEHKFKALTFFYFLIHVQRKLFWNRWDRFSSIMKKGRYHFLNTCSFFGDVWVVLQTFLWLYRYLSQLTHLSIFFV